MNLYIYKYKDSWYCIHFVEVALSFNQMFSTIFLYYGLQIINILYELLNIFLSMITMTVEFNFYYNYSVIKHHKNKLSLLKAIVKYLRNSFDVHC